MDHFIVRQLRIIIDKRSCIILIFTFPSFVLMAQTELIKDSISVKEIRINQKTITPELFDQSIIEHEPQYDIKWVSMDFKLNHSPKTKIPGSNLFIPGMLISYGIIAQYTKPLVEMDMNIRSSVKAVQLVKYDDYFQYAPIAGVYILDMAGIKAKHNIMDRTIVMATSYLLMSATIQTMKHTINVQRPDGSNLKSFPSGHTATVFTGSHILFKEYKNSCPWIGVGAYGIAAATGILRMTNNKHWLSDVVTGAGIGILSAEVAYMLLPTMHKVFGIKDSRRHLVILPSVGINQYGISLSYSF
jgi:hypothetical protein